MYNLNPDNTPSVNFFTLPWQLQLPVKYGKSILIIKYPELQTYTSEYFYTASDGSMAFKCPTNGYTTENSKYPRSELRENEEWDLLKNIHLLTTQCKIVKVAKGKGVIIGQIHGTESKLNPQVCKLYYDPNGDVYLQHKCDKNPSDTEIKVKLGKVNLGDVLNYSFFVNNGVIAVCVNDKKVVISFKNTYWNKQKYYFKLGNYLQDNNKGDDFSIVQFYYTQLIHE